MYTISLAVTFVVGLSMLIGTLLVLSSKKENNAIHFSIGLAFGIMILLIIKELIPEAYHSLKDNQFNYLIMIISLILGAVILKIIDSLVPHHEHSHKGTHKKENMLHIGIVASIALVLHNIIEGMALFGTTTESVKLGILLGIGIGLHNIPMGIIIASTFLEANKSKKKTFLISFGLALSTLVGGLIMFILRNQLISETIIGILVAITAGMLIYISIFELLPQIVKSNNKKLSYLGIIIGVAIFLLSHLF